MALACVFPGQGAQSVGMLAELASSQPEVKATFAEASEVLSEDLWQLTQEGPEATLNRTDRTQPVLLAAGVAVWRVWQARGGAVPAWLAGHSLGEYTALVCANALAFTDAVELVAERGRLMQAAVPEGQGAMAAILGLGDDHVAAVCEQAAHSEVVTAANFNAPGQVVIAGHSSAVERAVSQAQEAGAKRAVKLPVSVPSHCSLMAPAAEAMAEHLQQVALQTPQIPVIHNCDARPHAEPAEIRQALVHQLDHPVRWVETIETMASQGVDTLVEAGPGKILTGLNRRIKRDMSALPVYDSQTLDTALAQTGA